MEESGWHEALQKKLLQKFGSKNGAVLSKKYQHAFHLIYLEENSIDATVNDIEQLEKLTPDHPFALDLYQSLDPNAPSLRLRIYQCENPIPLSDILPLLENLDLRTLDERAYKILIDKKPRAWISDFTVTNVRNVTINTQTIDALLQDIFTEIRFGNCENDGLNKLVLGAELSWHEITILRAYTKYLHQIGFRYNQAYIEVTLANYASIAGDLITLFKLLHDPTQKSSEANQAPLLEEKIVKRLESVTSLDEDRILRSFLNLIKSTLRTNYFLNKDYLSFKLASKNIFDLPLPRPLYEIFVYSPRFEGIHLRSEKVARGGIRWSDRREDFRTEILGLMKAQKVKNAVIVPSGAKGGFVLKKIPLLASREVIQQEVVACYRSFISGLLDLTDNIKNDKAVHPKNIVCLDDFDPYLVVAADKGTATFSDLANSIAKEYEFWLGDAFASGGSAGYDHKKMGITARGTWESIKRHFHELNINYANTTFTVVGIGDMSGDVFGNGMLYSKNIKLLAAFDHRHIFLDPNPEPDTSYQERARLFNLSTSSWEDYNPTLISSGGGVFKRTSKSIVLTPEIKIALGIQGNALTPNELIRAILKAPVDLLYNGGIGTYVKASTETTADVGDKTNEFCQINGNELRCKMVGEGGNLGFTQLGRIEYALTGGLINTDFIDNSAGVDCSDHEVNAKILLNKEIAKGKLTEKKRNELLATMTDEIAKLVLTDNYNQALVMSFSAAKAVPYISLYQEHIRELENLGILDRAIEFLPDEKKIVERKASKLGLTRPELAVLLAYTKIHIKKELLQSNLPEEAYFTPVVETAFPTPLCKQYKNAMQEHSLKREIIATQLSNRIVNEMGLTFVHRHHIETGASLADIVRAQTAASRIFQLAELQTLIESLDFKIPLAMQYELLHHVRHLINLGTRWFLRHDRLKGDLSLIIKHYSDRVKILENIIPDLMTGSTKDYLALIEEQFTNAGLSKNLAQRIAACRALYTSLNIIEVATENNFDLVQTANVYFAAGNQFNLVWFRDELATDTREGHWNAWARIALRDELDILQRTLTAAIINSNKKEQELSPLFDHWTSLNKSSINRWENILNLLHTSVHIEYSMFFISIREFLSLVNSSNKA
jgi:glutamate dehydrogenase